MGIWTVYNFSTMSCIETTDNKITVNHSSSIKQFLFEAIKKTYFHCFSENEKETILRRGSTKKRLNLNVPLKGDLN